MLSILKMIVDASTLLFDVEIDVPSFIYNENGIYAAIMICSYFIK